MLNRYLSPTGGWIKYFSILFYHTALIHAFKQNQPRKHSSVLFCCCFDSWPSGWKHRHTVHNKQTWTWQDSQTVDQTLRHIMSRAAAWWTTWGLWGAGAWLVAEEGGEGRGGGVGWGGVGWDFYYRNWSLNSLLFVFLFFFFSKLSPAQL